MSRPKIKNLSESSIARYQRAARAGNSKAAQRLAEAGIEIKKAKVTGRPQKEFSELKPVTQKMYARRIVKNLKELEKINKPRYEGRQSYKKIASSAEVLGTLESKVYGNKAADIYFNQFRKYSKKNAVSQRILEIRQSYEKSTGISTTDITDAEMRKFYESKYYVETEATVEDSDGLRNYYEQENETIDETRLKDFLENEVLKDYAVGSTDYERIMNLIYSL